MKKSVFMSLCAVLVGLLLYSCGPDDIKIQGEVKQILLMEAPTTSGIVRNGFATLQGTVETDEMKESLEAKVKEVNGVKAVVNEINVVPPVPVPTADETMQKVVSVALNEAGFKDLTVEVANEVVTLKGNVKKADQNKVLAIAKGFTAKNVVNELKVVK